MKNMLKSLILAGGLALATLPADAAVFYRGGVFMRPAYRPWGFYGPYWGYPYYGDFYGYPVHPHAGQIKFDTKEKDAQVFLDGSYAGTVKELNSAWIREGNHTIELRSRAGMVFDQKIYVVAGKTMHIRPDVAAPAAPPAPHS